MIKNKSYFVFEKKFFAMYISNNCKKSVLHLLQVVNMATVLQAVLLLVVAQILRIVVRHVITMIQLNSQQLPQQLHQQQVHSQHLFQILHRQLLRQPIRCQVSWFLIYTNIINKIKLNCLYFITFSSKDYDLEISFISYF